MPIIHIDIKNEEAFQEIWEKVEIVCRIVRTEAPEHNEGWAEATDGEQTIGIHMYPESDDYIVFEEVDPKEVPDTKEL